MTLEAPEVEIVKKSRIYCDGSDDVLGHPRVWLQIPPSPHKLRGFIYY